MGQRGLLCCCNVVIETKPRKQRVRESEGALYQMIQTQIPGREGGGQ